MKSKMAADVFGASSLHANIVLLGKANLKAHTVYNNVINLYLNVIICLYVINTEAVIILQLLIVWFNVYSRL